MHRIGKATANVEKQGKHKLFFTMPNCCILPINEHKCRAGLQQCGWEEVLWAYLQEPGPGTWKGLWCILGQHKSSWPPRSSAGSPPPTTAPLVKVAFCLVCCALPPHSGPGIGPCGKRDKHWCWCPNKYLQELRKRRTTATSSATEVGAVGSNVMHLRKAASIRTGSVLVCIWICLAHHRSWHDGLLWRRWGALRWGLSVRLGSLFGASTRLGRRQLYFHQLFYTEQDTLYH